MLYPVFLASGCVHVNILFRFVNTRLNLVRRRAFSVSDITQHRLATATHGLGYAGSFYDSYEASEAAQKNRLAAQHSAHLIFVRRMS